MGIEEFKSDHSWLSPVDYENLLEQVLQLVEDAGLLLITEWQRADSTLTRTPIPRASGQ